MRSRFLHWCIFQVILLPQFDETYAVTAFKIIPQNIVPLWPLTVSRNRLSNYWDTCGSPVMKCLCFFVVFFFFLRHKMEKLRNSTQRSLRPQHHDNQLWSNEVFTCWSRMLSWWWLTLSCTDRARSHDEHEIFAHKTLLGAVLVYRYTREFLLFS